MSEIKAVSRTNGIMTATYPQLGTPVMMLQSIILPIVLIGFMIVLALAATGLAILDNNINKKRPSH